MYKGIIRSLLSVTFIKNNDNVTKIFGLTKTKNKKKLKQ